MTLYGVGLGMVRFLFPAEVVFLEMTCPSAVPGHRNRL